MGYTFPVAYSGAAPGADANTYTLVNTRSIAGTGPLSPSDYRRYVLSLNNSEAGTLKVFGSADAGATWKQIYEKTVTAASATRNNDFAVPTLPHTDVKAEWVNGGVAQATWIVAQWFDDGVAAFGSKYADPSGDSDGGESTTVDSAQLPSSLGQKAMAASLAVVVASNQSGIPVTDGGGSFTVDAPAIPTTAGQKTGANSLGVVLASDQTLGQLPSALGPQTAATSLSVVQATTAVTDSTTYIVNGDMSAASIDGPSITIGKEGTLRAEISWSNTGAPVGTISLQHLMLDGTTWIDIPGASAEFTTQPNNNTVTLSCYWTGLQAYTTGRIKYTRASGGTANTSFNVDTRVR